MMIDRIVKSWFIVLIVISSANNVNTLYQQNKPIKFPDNPPQDHPSSVGTSVGVARVVSDVVPLNIKARAITEISVFTSFAYLILFSWKQDIMRTWYAYALTIQ